MDFLYPLQYLEDREFETLVVLICSDILGIGVNAFADRHDGGRDGRFEGTAQKYPSITDPWNGKFIIQSKHTRSPVGKCSDSDFRKQVNDEIHKLKNLIKLKDVDNYLMFTNRSMTGEENFKVRELIKAETGLDHSDLFGSEFINIHLNSHPEIADQIGLNKYVLPLNFYEQDIKELIQIFSQSSHEITKLVNEKESSIKRLDLETKNDKNMLSKDYFEFMLSSSVSYFHQIDLFLKDPINAELLKKYIDTAFELKCKIISKRNQFNHFNEIFEYIYDFMLNKHKDLVKQRRLIYTFLHYMYYNCDIGVT